MEKPKIVICMLALLIAPIIVNVILIIFYPIYFIASFIWDDKKFYKYTKKYERISAKLE